MPSPLNIARCSKEFTPRSPARGSPVTFGKEMTSRQIVQAVLVAPAVVFTPLVWFVGSANLQASLYPEQIEMLRTIYPQLTATSLLLQAGLAFCASAGGLLALCISVASDVGKVGPRARWWLAAGLVAWLILVVIMLVRGPSPSSSTAERIFIFWFILSPAAAAIWNLALILRRREEEEPNQPPEPTR